MRFLIILGIVSVAFGQGIFNGQGGQGYGGQVGYGQQLNYPEQGYAGQQQQQYLVPGQYPLYPYQLQPQQGQLYPYQLPYGYQQLGYNPPLIGYPLTQFQYPYQTGVGPAVIRDPGVAVPVPVVKEVDFIQPGISGAVPLTTMDAALLELEDKDYGHYEKYYYGRSGIPAAFIRPIRQGGQGQGQLDRSRSGGIPLNQFLRPGNRVGQPPFKVNKREHYEIYKYH